MAARRGPVFVYERNEMSEVPLEFLDKNLGEDRFRGNYNLFTIINEIMQTSRKARRLHDRMQSRGNFIRSLNLLKSYHEQTYCIVPLCHYVVLCNYLRMAKTLSFKYPVFRRHGYTEDTDLHYYLNLWLMIGNLVDETSTFYENLEKLESKSEAEAKAIVLKWAKNMARNLFKLRKKIHVLPEYTPLLPINPYPPHVTACLRESFGVFTHGGSWAEFQNYPDSDTSEESDDEPDDENSQEEPETGIPGENAASGPDEPYCACPFLQLAINPKMNDEWKKHKFHKCQVCNCFQNISQVPFEEIPFETYMVSTQSENREGHFCHFPREMQMEDNENGEEYGYNGDNEDNADAVDNVGRGNYQEYEECVENKYSGNIEDSEDIEGRGEYVVVVPNHRFGTITNARIINALMKGLDPLAEFQNPNHVHANRADYNLRTISGCNEEAVNSSHENTNSANPGTSCSNVGITNQETASNTSRSSDDTSEDNGRPKLSINFENLLEFVQQGWHTFPISASQGYMFPSFMKTITRYLYNMDPEGKEIFTFYTNILMNSCRILINKAFNSDPSTALYKMRFHLKLIPHIHALTVQGLEEILQIGLNVIAYDIPNLNWVKRQMKDHLYNILNMFNYESLSLLETAIHGVPGSCKQEIVKVVFNQLFHSLSPNAKSPPSN